MRLSSNAASVCLGEISFSILLMRHQIVTRTLKLCSRAENHKYLIWMHRHMCKNLPEIQMQPRDAQNDFL